MTQKRFVSITRYAELVGINRESVYKRINAGTAVLYHDSEVPIIDLALSKGTMNRNNWADVRPVRDLPF